MGKEVILYGVTEQNGSPPKIDSIVAYEEGEFFLISGPKEFLNFQGKLPKDSPLISTSPMEAKQKYILELECALDSAEQFLLKLESRLGEAEKIQIPEK